ncbi:MAG: hypothetical protein ACOC80_15115 [Petrotogales bacterium]
MIDDTIDNIDLTLGQEDLSVKMIQEPIKDNEYSFGYWPQLRLLLCKSVLKTIY